MMIIHYKMECRHTLSPVVPVKLYILFQFPFVSTNLQTSLHWTLIESWLKFTAQIQTHLYENFLGLIENSMRFSGGQRDLMHVQFDIVAWILYFVRVFNTFSSYICWQNFNIFSSSVHSIFINLFFLAKIYSKIGSVSINPKTYLVRSCNQ